MHPQLQEEMEHQMGYANEFQNAYALSKLQHVNPDEDSIQASLKAGNFVVIVFVLAYCKFTDAALGCDRYHVADCPTYEAAEEYIANNEEEFFGSEGPGILCPAGFTPPQTEPVDVFFDEDLPF